MSWLHYLLEANIYLAVFYLLYFILLDRETHYKLSRIYLLSACIIAYIIPVVQVGILKPADDGLQVVSIIRNGNFKAGAGTGLSAFTLQNGLILAYIAGAGIMLVMFFFKIARLVRLTRTQKDLLDDKYKVIRLEDSNTAFSFFNYLFIGTKVSGPDTVIRHELVHINQKHSFDIIFLELIKIVSWFNPFVYLIQRSVKTVHEYIADEQTAAFENDAIAYSSFLVSNAYGVSGSSITHSFFNYNLLKKRIIMLNQKRSGNLARLKYLTALPVCAGLLCASTLGFSKTYGLIDIAPQKVTDTTKMLKLKEVKASPTVKIKNEIATARKKAVKVKEVPKIQEIRIDPVKDTTKTADLVIEAPIVKTDFNSKVLAQNKKLTIVRKADPVVKADVFIDKKQPVALQLQNVPPPMAPFLSPAGGFDALQKSIQHTVRYPARARESNVVGSVIVKFDVDDSHKIGDIIVLKGVGSGCDEEVVRSLKAFTGQVNTKAGNYKLAVTFILDGLEAPKPASNELAKDPSFAGEVVVVGYGVKK